MRAHFHVADRPFPAPDAVQPVGFVVAALVEMNFGVGEELFADGLAFVGVARFLFGAFPKFELAAVDMDLSVGAVKPDAVASLVDDLDPVRVEQTHAVLRLLPVGRGNDFVRSALVHAEAPLRDVEMVRAPIGHAAAAVFAVVAPIGKMLVNAARAQFGIVSAFGRRAEPHVPVQAGFVRLSRQITRDCRTTDGDLHHPNPADDTVAHEFARGAKFPRGPLHGAGLEHDVVLAHRLHHGLRFVNRLAKRFFAVDVFLRVGGCNRNKRVPMVGRRDDDRIDVFASDQFAEIVISGAPFVRAVGRFGCVVILDHLLRVLAACGVHVAHGEHLGLGVGQKAAEQTAVLSSHANETKRDAVVGFHFGGPDARRQDKGRGGGDGGGLDEGTAREISDRFHSADISCPSTGGANGRAFFLMNSGLVSSLAPPERVYETACSHSYSRCPALAQARCFANRF